MGFCVASTMNGRGSVCVCASTVTCASFIASSSADCVFGVVRLISSARTMLAKMGPGLKSNRWSIWLNMLERAMKRVRQALRQGCLAYAGDILDEKVPPGQQGHDGEANDFVFTANDARNRAE